MKDNIFLDTNILIYAFDIIEPKKQISKDLLQLLIKKNNYFISTQVIQEFFVTVTQKIKKKMTIDVAEAFIKNISHSQVVSIEIPIILQAIKIHNQYRLSFWDSLIIATALKSKCTILYSEDMQHNMMVDNKLQIINPYRTKDIIV